MVTNQLMKREFNGTQITQRTKDSFFNATELLAVYNSNNESQSRLFDFFSNQTTKNFIEVLEKDLILNSGNNRYLENTIKCYESTRGKGGSTYMHPYLFVKFAMWLSPQFELAIIKWVYDNLIEVRHQAGDYYKEMCDTIQKEYINLKGEKPDPLIFVNEAKFINSLCQIKDGKRNELNEKELKLLSDLQKLNISLIKNHTPEQKRKQMLFDYSQNFKIINNI